MDRREYKERLEALISCLSEAEREEAVSFYVEAIADRVDEGATEAEAVASLAPPEEAAKAILAEKAAEAVRTDGLHSGNLCDTDGFPGAHDKLAVNSEPETKRKGLFKRLKHRELSPLEWVAVIVTSPLWLALLLVAVTVVLAAIIVVLAAWMVAWVLVGCVWIVGGAFVLATPVAALYAVWGMQVGNGPYALVNVGYALFLFGAGMWVLRGAYRGTRAFHAWQKKCIAAKVNSLGNRQSKETGEESNTDTGEGVNAETERSESASGAETAGSQASGASGLDGATAEAVRQHATQRRWKAFFKVCLILLLSGIAFVLLGFMASGFDWRVFLTSLYSEGTFYLGGVEVEDPTRLLWSPFHMLVALGWHA